MAEAILLLRVEHQNMGELLDIVEQQLEQDGSLDLELLKNIIDYFFEYPEQCHHPIENLIFRKLQSRDSSRAETISEILQDHKTISDLTKLVDSSLKETESEDIKATKLREHIRRFVDIYRAHIKAEEITFFPMALSTLTKTDWDVIEFELYDRKDPLVDIEVEARFRSLSDKVRKLADRSTHSNLLIRKTKQLNQLTTIQGFNNMMENSDYNYRIVKYPEGGYGLKLEGKVVIDIPKCSQTRAAWCAFFYVKAATGI